MDPIGTFHKRQKHFLSPQVKPTGKKIRLSLNGLSGARRLQGESTSACRAPKKKDSKGDTPIPHQSLYPAQDSSRQVAHQSPSVDGATSLLHHSHPLAGRLGIMRSTEGVDLCPYGRTRVVART